MFLLWSTFSVALYYIIQRCLYLFQIPLHPSAGLCHWLPVSDFPTSFLWSPEQLSSLLVTLLLTSATSCSNNMDNQAQHPNSFTHGKGFSSVCQEYLWKNLHPPSSFYLNHNVQLTHRKKQVGAFFIQLWVVLRDFLGVIWRKSADKIVLCDMMGVLVTCSCPLICLGPLVLLVLSLSIIIVSFNTFDIGISLSRRSKWTHLLMCCPRYKFICVSSQNIFLHQGTNACQQLFCKRHVIICFKQPGLDLESHELRLWFCNRLP